MKAGRNLGRFLFWSDPEAVNTSPPVLGNLQRPAELFLEPEAQPLIVGIGPDERDPGKQEVEIGKQKHAARLVVEIGWMNLGLEDGALRIDKDLPLATGDLLAAIVAARPAGFGGLHRLTVDDRGARLRVPAARLAIVLAQDLIYSFPFAVFAPLAE